MQIDHGGWAALRDDLPDETWRTARGCSGAYDVSSLGRVWSGRKERILTGTLIKGYRNVRLAKGRKSALFPVHRLVCEAFHGPCPPGKEMVGHLDGNPLNNRADNLAWITRSENTLHSIAHGTFAGKPPAAASGEAHHASKLTAEQVDQIRTRALAGEQKKPLAREFGISGRQVRRIVSGEKWASSVSRPSGDHQAQGCP